MSTQYILAIIGAAAAIVLGVPAIVGMVKSQGTKRTLDTVLLSLAVFALGFGVSALIAATASSNAPDKQSLAVQTLSFKDSNLELTPTQNSVFRKTPDNPDSSWVESAEFDYVLVNIFDANGSAAVLSRKTDYTVGGSTSVSLTGLAPGTYSCVFYGMKDDTEAEYYYLYYNPKQFFQWDGAKGEFL